jgi:hypothetical protein
MIILTYDEAFHRRVHLTTTLNSSYSVNATSIYFVRPSKDGGASYLSDGCESKFEQPRVHHVKETFVDLSRQLWESGLPTLKLMGVYLTPQGAESLKTSSQIRKAHGFADPASTHPSSPLSADSLSKVEKFLSDYAQISNRNVLTISLGGSLGANPEIIDDFINYVRDILPQNTTVTCPKEPGKITVRFSSQKEGQDCIAALRHDRLQHECPALGLDCG